MSRIIVWILHSAIVRILSSKIMCTLECAIVCSKLRGALPLWTWILHSTIMCTLWNTIMCTLHSAIMCTLRNTIATSCHLRICPYYPLTLLVHRSLVGNTTINIFYTVANYHPYQQSVDILSLVFYFPVLDWFIHQSKNKKVSFIFVSYRVRISMQIFVPFLAQDWILMKYKILRKSYVRT